MRPGRPTGKDRRKIPAGSLLQYSWTMYSLSAESPSSPNRTVASGKASQLIRASTFHRAKGRLISISHRPPLVGVDRAR